MKDVRRYGAETKKSGTSPMFASVSGQWVHWDDHSALAADLASAVADKEAYGQNAIDLRKQRDEGLAREAELKDAAEGYRVWGGGMRLERDALQQRLAKAQEVLAKAIYRQWYDAPGYIPWVEGGNSLKQWEAREEAIEQLRDAGCADGEKAQSVEPAPVPGETALHQRAGRMAILLQRLSRDYFEGSIRECDEEAREEIRAMLAEEPTYVFETGAYQVELSQEQWDRVHTVFENYNESATPEDEFQCAESDINGLVSEILVALELAEAE